MSEHMPRLGKPKYIKQVRPRWRDSFQKLQSTHGGESACPFCPWKGYLVQTVSHITMNHNCHVANGPSFKFTLPLTSDQIKIVHAFGQYFLVVVKSHERNRDNCQIRVFFASLQIIGTPEQANHFSYKLEIVSGSPILDKWTAHHTPLSVRDGVLSGTIDSEGLIFKMQTSNNIRAERHPLSLKGTVFKKDRL